ncbi:MAG: hypothetical protein F4Z65_08075 [Acidobacteria bacterium]|nr:hypothetical protein [Acidobacteriota bacterium]MYI40363.1 hypothetical protein [Acidobacteriota bacterium]
MPTPFDVHFDIPEGEFPMVPDKDDDEATAMAMVNTDIEVGVNMPAIVSATFMPDASPIGLVPGHNHPFEYVNWGALQSMVVTTGVTFAVQPVEIGANQVPLPIGDAALITCGPFACADGPMPPPISIADSPVCAGWMPDAMLNVGLVDNDVFDLDGDDTVSTTDTDGIDAGWVTDSTAAMTVKHKFSGVEDGKNYDVAGPDASKGSDKALTLDKVKSATASTWDDNHGYGDGIQIRMDDNVAAGGANPTLEASNNPSACYAATSYGETIGQNHRPANCFRVVADGANYLDGYSIEVAAKDSEVMWGMVEWEDNPFVDAEGEDLTCDPMEFMATDAMAMSVCDLFEDEVDQALDGGWGNEDLDGNGSVASSERGHAQVVINAESGNANEGNVEMWRASVRGASMDRFKTLWFDDDLDGKIRTKTSDMTPGPEGPNDLYDLAHIGTVGAAFQDDGANNNLDVIWKLLRDKDNDPTMGDFGKVDLVRSTDNAATTTVDERIVPGNSDGKADNYVTADDANACSDDDGGDGCDAMWSEDYEVLFADGLFGCTTKRMVTISCEWDANGELGRYREDDHTAWVAAATTTGPSAGLNLVQAEAAGARTGGWIGAFAKCTIK